MLEGIRCRIKFYFLLSLFFMPVAMGEWRSRVIASCDRPSATEPDPNLAAIIRAQEEADAREAAAATVADHANRLADLDRGEDELGSAHP